MLIFWNKIKRTLELSFQLAKTGFKLRNEGSYFGIFWYLLSPLSLFLILILISKFVGIYNQEYPIYLLIGLIVFNFFSHSMVQSANSITYNAHIIKSMKINQESLVIASVFQAIFSHFFEIGLLIIFLIFYENSLIGLFFYPLVFIFFVIFILGMSFILSTLGVFISDLNNFLSVLITLLWFTTPIFYFIDKSSFLYNANLFNPLFYFIEITREIIIYNRAPELWMIFIATLSSILILILGLYLFSKYKYKFAEAL